VRRSVLENCVSKRVATPGASVGRLPNSSGLVAETDTYYNAYSLPIETDNYDFGSGSPGALLGKTLTSYASLNGIVDHPASITVQDGSGATKAQTSFTYDEGTVTTTSGTPQLTTPPAARGNPTTMTSLVQGSTTLTKHYTYFDTGNVNTATDVNGAQTSYVYGTGSCGNSFPTQINLPLNLSRSMAWNCTGGTAVSSTDENGQNTSTTWNDPYFWRPAASTDQAGNVTNLAYSGATVVTSSLLFNGGNSVAESRVLLDSLGRPSITQRRQGPGASNYDSVETDYDSLGRPYKSSLPYSAAAGQADPSWKGTTTTYDALGRPTQTTDSGGGTVTLTYNKNDVLSVVGPAPTGENTKQRQLEYDGLGRLKSVCEKTSGSGSGTCAQTNSLTGYWTQYTYDVLGNLTGVTQNAQGTSQGRSYAYDDLGRMTSETNPETGTTSYTYDTDATCGSTSSGDLVKRIDAVGNITCYFYDSLHRVTSTTYSGPYASRTPAKCFVYDGATVNGATMQNAKGRMAEAYTAASCPNSTKTTDIGFSYSVRGELADVYESTPHSGGYYHATASYWANGALHVLNPLNSTALPTFTYSADNEGRPSAVTASAGTNPVSSTAYNVASQPTGLTFGTADSDAFGFDSNTGRMTQYQFTVGYTPQTVTGQLGWNANGSLASLGITDQFNSANTQSCTYSHDDLGRISSVNCGSVWSQSFGFDPFGNLTKSGSVSFQPTYNTATNRMSSLPGYTPTYDANGNTTADSLHTYAWDVEGRASTIDSVSLTYDALGRMVEQQNGSSYTEIFYGPTGKLALMSGQTVSKAFIPLTAGATAVYTSGPTLSYFRHSDWLGSSRFASTPSRTMYSDLAYAPFGETYAEAGTPDRSFTGQNQDTVPGSTTGLYDFMYREYAQYGRWISPDPAGLGAVSLGDPQSWNRYAYVRNSPLAFWDVGGLGCDYDECFDPLPDCDPGSCFHKDAWAEYAQDKPPSETGGVWEIPYDPLDGLRSLEYHANFGPMLVQEQWRNNISDPVVSQNSSAAPPQWSKKETDCTWKALAAGGVAGVKDFVGLPTNNGNNLGPSFAGTSPNDTGGVEPTLGDMALLLKDPTVERAVLGTAARVLSGAAFSFAERAIPVVGWGLALYQAGKATIAGVDAYKKAFDACMAEPQG
jgi:RHS repeat-associated protein